jgi:hypothetical protein
LQNRLALSNSGRLKFIVTVALLLLCSLAHAQRARPLSGEENLINDFLRTNNPAFDKWDIGLRLRMRVEHKEYFAGSGPTAVDFAARGDADNTYLLLREKLHIGYTPRPWVTMFVEGRDSSSQNDHRNPNPDSDSMDLFQAFIRLGGDPRFPLTLKAGRQELAYGDELLIGKSDFSNVPRSFDAIKLYYEGKKFRIDAFTSHRVIARANAFNQSDGDELFSALYANTKNWLPKHSLQFYFIARNVDSTAPNITVPLNNIPSPRDIYTAGGRIESFTNAVPGWDYNVEGAYQFGRFKNTLTSPSLRQDAFATHIAAGHTWFDVTMQPRVGLEYNFSSGDDNPKDGVHRTFDILFPSNHRPFGLMDLVSWANIHDANLTTLFHPVKSLSITNEVHGFWLADNHDFFYNVNGQPRNTGGYGIKPDAGRFLGTEYDFLASYDIDNLANFQLGYGHFFVGEYVKNSLAPVGGAKDANWVYFQVILNF